LKIILKKYKNILFILINSKNNKFVLTICKILYKIYIVYLSEFYIFFDYFDYLDYLIILQGTQ